MRCNHRRLTVAIFACCVVLSVTRSFLFIRTLTSSSQQQERQNILDLPVHREHDIPSPSSSSSSPPPSSSSSSSSSFNLISADVGVTTSTQMMDTKKTIEKKPFPRWDDDYGISIYSIKYYIKLAATKLGWAKDILCKAPEYCHPAMPNVIYIFGGTTNIGVQGEYNASSIIQPKVWVESKRRKKVGSGFKKRYPIIEQLMELSLREITSNPIYRNTFLYQIVQNSSFGLPLILNLGDPRHCCQGNLRWNAKQYDVPIFTLAAPIDCGYTFPIPHPALLDTSKTHGTNWSNIFQQRDERYPWEEKVPKAVWRGSQTGMMPTNNSTNKEHSQQIARRYNMVVQAHNTPHQLDDNNIDNDNDKDNENHQDLFDVGYGRSIRKLNITRKVKMPLEDFQKFRVVLDVDGSSWSERLALLLCMNSIVAKVDPEFVDYFWYELQPWVHYIPISLDSSDLWNITRWAVHSKNYQHVKTIIANANDWCEHKLTMESMIKDFIHILTKYVHWLDKNNTNWSDIWTREMTTGIPVKNHQWKSLPLQEPESYFSLIRKPWEGEERLSMEEE